MNHYLLTISTSDRQHLHGYLMCNGNWKLIENALNRMMNWLESQNFDFSQSVLSTKLTTGIDIVRRLACKQGEEVARKMAQATNFHLTVWIVPREHPDDALLMEQHPAGLPEIVDLFQVRP